MRSFTDSTYFGVIYIGRFLKKEIIVLSDINQVPVSVVYKNTLYCISPVGYKGAAAVKDLYAAYRCKTKVFLYPNSRSMLFKDEDGVFKDSTIANHSYRIDYADCIPIPNYMI